MKQVTYVAFVLVLFVGICYAFLNDSTKSEDVQKKAAADSLKTEIQSKVATIFKNNCATSGCHKGRYPKKRLNLEKVNFFDAVVNVSSREIDTLKLVDTKKPQESYLLMKVKGSKGIVEERMPIEAPPLKGEEIKIIEDWILSIAETDLEKVEIPSSKKVKKVTKDQ